MSHEALKALLAPQLPSIFFCRNSTKRITVGDEGYDPEMRSQLDIGTLTAPTLPTAIFDSMRVSCVSIHIMCVYIMTGPYVSGQWTRVFVA